MIDESFTEGPAGDHGGPRRIRFDAISPRAWEHPADRAALTALRTIPVFDEVLKKLFGILGEKPIRLAFQANAVQVSERQFTRVHRIYDEVLHTLDAPEAYPLFVSQTPMVNAGAYGMDKPFVILNSGALSLLDDEELRYVLAHEVGHILSGHVLYRTMMVILLQLAERGFPLVGLAARSIPLVVPRAHDCITLLLGSKERYLEYFRSQPGAYFKTSGWIERGDDLEQLSGESIQRRSRMAQSYADLVGRYGEDNARFLQEELRQMTRNYSRIAYIAMGIEPDDRFEREARDMAAARGWQFDQLVGDMRLIQELVDGPWNDADFLTVPPGHRIAASFDDAIVRAEPDE